MGKTIVIAIAAVAGVLVLAGCGQDRPHRYARQRPAADTLDYRDRGGLQSKDVIDATDTLAMYMLQLPEFNQPERRAVVVTRVENRTTNPRFNYDIFIQRLRANISEQGRDRIALISQRQRIDQLQREELDFPVDPYLQMQAGADGEGRLQPEFALHGSVSELPQRGTSFYLFDFTLTNLRTREEIPMKWEVRVAR